MNFSAVKGLKLSNLYGFKSRCDELLMRLCAVDRSSEQRRLVDAQKYQMMDVAVQSAHQDPLIVVENQR